MGATTGDPAPRGGDGEFRRLFDRYHRPVFTFFANRGLGVEDCRELTQETFLGAYAGRARFRGEADTATWLFAIARNIWRRRLRDSHREKRRGEEVPLGELPIEPVAATAAGESQADPLDRALAAERERLMREALGELPELMRACTVLRIDQGLSYREIATVFRIPEDRVKSQLFQARERLRKLLSRRFEEIEA
jgi:RNA polymerase sigma-70 factor (ECF subfamily)